MTDDIQDWLGPVATLLRVVPVLQEQQMRGGVRAVVSSVELWTHEICWHLAYLPSPPTLDPAHPRGMAVMTDNLGTAYPFTSMGGGGTDRSQRFEYGFRGPLPDGVTHLTLSGGELGDCTFTVEL